MQPSDILVTKRSRGAFATTDLEQQLRDRGVTQIVLTGISTSAGVESTAREAHERGFNVTLATDATTDSSADAYAYSLANTYPKISETGTTSEILALLRRLADGERHGDRPAAGRGERHRVPAPGQRPQPDDDRPGVLDGRPDGLAVARVALAPRAGAPAPAREPDRDPRRPGEGEGDRRRAPARATAFLATATFGRAANAGAARTGPAGGAPTDGVLSGAVGGVPVVVVVVSPVVVVVVVVVVPACRCPSRSVGGGVPSDSVKVPSAPATAITPFSRIASTR